MQLLPRRMAVWWRWQDNKVADWPVCIDKTARWPHQHAGKACCWWFFVVVSFLFLNFLFLFLQFFSTFATPAKYSTSKQRQRGDKRTRRAAPYATRFMARYSDAHSFILSSRYWRFSIYALLVCNVKLKLWKKNFKLCVFFCFAVRARK